MSSTGGRVRPIDVLIRGVDQLSTQIADVNRKIEGMNAPARRASADVSTLAGRLKMSGVGEALGRVGNRLSSLVRLSSQLALGGGLFGAGAIAGMQRFIGYGDDIGATATRIGMGAKELQELRYAAEQMDLPQDRLEAGLDKLSKNMGQAVASGGKMKAFFEALGVDLQRGPVEALDVIADRIKGLSPELQREVVGIGMGRGNKEFVNLLREGSPAIARYRREAAALGFVLEDSTVQALGEADNELRRLKYSALGAAAIIGTELLPDVRQMVLDMTQWIKENRAWIRSSVVPEIRNFVTWMREAVPQIKAIVDGMGGWKSIAIGVAGVIGVSFVADLIALASALNKLAMGVGAVNLAVGIGSALLNPWVLAISAISVVLTQLYDRFEPFRNFVDWGWEKIKAGVAAFGEDEHGIDEDENSLVDRIAGGGRKKIRQRRRRRELAGRRLAPALGPAEGYAGTQLFTGNIGIDLNLPRGVTGRVGPMRASPGLGLDVGMNMGF